MLIPLEKYGKQLTHINMISHKEGFIIYRLDDVTDKFCVQKIKCLKKSGLFPQ